MAGYAPTQELLPLVSDLYRQHLHGVVVDPLTDLESWKSDYRSFPEGFIALESLSTVYDISARRRHVVGGDMLISEDPRGRCATKIVLSAEQNNSQNPKQVKTALELFKVIASSHKGLHEVCRPNVRLHGIQLVSVRDAASGEALYV